MFQDRKEHHHSLQLDTNQVKLYPVMNLSNKNAFLYLNGRFNHEGISLKPPRNCIP
jgi:hypothetical protein